MDSMLKEAFSGENNVLVLGNCSLVTMNALLKYRGEDTRLFYTHEGENLTEMLDNDISPAIVWVEHFDPAILDLIDKLNNAGIVLLINLPARNTKAFETVVRYCEYVVDVVNSEIRGVIKRGVNID